VARKRRVLVVEDEDTIREVLVTALAEEGYAVRGRAQSSQALELLSSWMPDLILLDLMLPGLDGWGFLTERQRRGLGADVPVIVVSASRQGLADARTNAQVVAVLPKPFNLDVLLETVERILPAGDAPAH
jgi:CheY-like chemotaxis protein